MGIIKTHLSRLRGRYKAKNALQYCICGKHRVGELICANNDEYEYISSYIVQYIMGTEFEDQMEVLRYDNHIVLFFNGNSSYLTIRM